MDLLIYSLSTMLGLVIIGMIVFWFIQDITQKKHSVLRNYPVIGRLRFFFEQQGKYFRQYLFSDDRDEMPLTALRATGFTGIQKQGWTGGIRLHHGLTRTGLDYFRECRFSDPGRRSVADTVAADRRRLRHISV